jgi:hypothetical protein
MASQYLGDLKKHIGEVMKTHDAGEPVQLNRAVELISKNFAVQPHEVAILALATDTRFLRFVLPENLRTVGQIPLSSTNSLASRTVREKRPEIVNHFSFVPHASVFEAVPIADEQRGEPIQKIMSSPISFNNKVIGVIQVSRKGRTAADAGPDFTHPELRELKSVADILAPCIVHCVRE